MDKLLAHFDIPESERDTIFPIVDRDEAAQAIRGLPKEAQASALDGIDLTDLDLFTSGFPHEVFSELRRVAPVYRHEPTSHTPDGQAFWAVSFGPCGAWQPLQPAPSPKFSGAGLAGGGPRPPASPAERSEAWPAGPCAICSAKPLL